MLPWAASDDPNTDKVGGLSSFNHSLIDWETDACCGGDLDWRGLSSCNHLLRETGACCGGDLDWRWLATAGTPLEPNSSWVDDFTLTAWRLPGQLTHRVITRAGFNDERLVAPRLQQRQLLLIPLVLLLLLLLARCTLHEMPASHPRHIMASIRTERRDCRSHRSSSSIDHHPLPSLSHLRTPSEAWRRSSSPQGTLQLCLRDASLTLHGNVVPVVHVAGG